MKRIVAAPGENIISTYPIDRASSTKGLPQGYQSMSGTSMVRGEVWGRGGGSEEWKRGGERGGVQDGIGGRACVGSGGGGVGFWGAAGSGEGEGFPYTSQV